MTSIMAVYGFLVLFAFGHVASVIAGTLGPICLHCTDVSGPTHCATVTQCGAHEQCYLDTFVNSMGGIVYRQGCRDNRQCQLQPFIVGKRDISGELLVCSQCCSGNVCNSAGCGHSGYPSPHGPVCFNCQDQLKTDSCNTITLCGVDEVCNLHITTNGVIHDRSYETKCMHRQECEADLVNFQKIISPGKQDVVDSLSSGGICLFQCCSTEVCNNGCSNYSQSTSATKPPVTTLGASSAFVPPPDHCLSNPCRRGTCSELGYTYKCTCEQGFYGRDCENDAIHVANTEASSTPGNVKVSVISTTPTTITPIKPSKTPAAVQNLTYATTFQPYASTSSKYLSTMQDTHPTVNAMPFTSAPTIPKETTTIPSTTVSTTTVSRCLSNPCIHGDCHDIKESFVCVCGEGYNGTYCNITIPSDCCDILHMGKGKVSGIYNVTLWKSHGIIQVYCDMDTDGGGWTVLQSRFDGSLDFYQNFSQYEHGFGSLNSEFWLGLAYAHEMVAQGQTELRLDLTAADNSTAYEVFRNFRLGDKPDYTLHIEPGKGTTDDIHGLGLFYHNNRPFATYDRDTGHQCAVTDHGGWWYGNCAFANLNGEYTTPGTNSSYNDGEGGMIYANFQNMFSLKSSQMKFRRF